VSNLILDNLFGILVSGLLIVVASAFALYYVRSRRAMRDIQAESTAKNKEFEKQAEALEEQTRNARSASQAKSDFLSRMSHEIRTPLNAIIGMTQVAKNSKDMAQVKEYLSNVEANSRHLLRIVSDILDFSKVESGKMKLEEKLFSLRETVEFVVNMFRDRAIEKNLVLVADTNDIQHDGLITDSLRLSQVLINLMSNAIKFTDKGEICLSVEELYYNNSEGVYRFSVRDTGIGIDPLQAAKLFTSFTQAGADTSRLFGGTGLGLAISKDLVSMLGGEIELETKPNLGSTFSFTIRVKAQKGAQQMNLAEAQSNTNFDMSGKNVLAVDDISINCEIVKVMLENVGANVLAAENGKEALDIFVESPVNFFDLILMDIQMPIMNGYEATEQIRNLERPDAKSVVIAAISANALPDDVLRANQVGMNGYLAKPIDAERLYKKIGEWLG
jgi:signal transduction histidine kinase/CheY-like chemotaxis protein